jgi:hypothetical protein
MVIDVTISKEYVETPWLISASRFGALTRRASSAASGEMSV